MDEDEIEEEVILSPSSGLGAAFLKDRDFVIEDCEEMTQEQANIESSGVEAERGN